MTEVAKCYQPTDYLYVSARLRAKQKGVIDWEKLTALAELPTREEMLAALVAEGVRRVQKPNGSPDVEAMLAGLLQDMIDTVKGSVPDPRLVALLQYRYDCNNLKILEKCRIRGISPEGLLSPLGWLSPDEITAAFAADNLSALPAHLAKGLLEARETYAANRNPREIDLALDRALFADLLEVAAPFAYATALVQKRIDLSNILAFLRLSSGGEIGRSVFSSAFLEGGTLAKDLFENAIEEGESALAAALADTPFAPLFSGTNQDFAAREKCADDLFLTDVMRGRHTPFGVEVPIAYLFATDTAVKNLRILFAAKKLGKGGEILKRSLRTYV